MDDRRYDIDWLRVFATYLLFPFHVAKVFDVPPYYPIKSPDLYWAPAYFATFVHQWHMPLFFLMAGWSLEASLRIRGPKAAFQERISRIFVPFLFGSATLCLLIGYYERVLMAGDSLSFWAYVPRFFTRLDYFTWSHLWFLIYLFVFTALWMPLFRYLAARRDRLRLARSWYIYRPLPALILLQGILRIWWPGYQNLYNDWGNFSYYSIMMIFGFLMGCQPALGAAIDREWRRAAGIAAGLTPVFLWMLSRREWPDEIRHITYYVSGTILGYMILVALFGFARQYFSFTNRALAYAAESALPVYILHQAAIVVPGWYIVPLPWSMPARFALLLAVSLVITMAVYHGLVRPFNGIRFFFGMKKKKRPAASV